MKHLYFFYFLVTFSIGNMSLGVITFIYSKTKEKRILYYLYAYVPFTLVVIFYTALAYIETNIPEIYPGVLRILQYCESLSVLSLIYAVPLSLHTSYSVSSLPSKNRIFAGLALFTYMSYHVFEFVFTQGVFRSVGEYLVRGILIGVMVYCVVIDVRYHTQITDPVRKRIERNGTILFLVFLPGFIYDFTVSEVYSFRFYPIFYCGFSLMFTYSAYRQYFHPTQVKENALSAADEAISLETFFEHYNISAREQDIVELVLQGYSNQKIAETLYISLNTVKAHLRNIYPKFKVKSRYELITFIRNAYDNQR